MRTPEDALARLSRAWDRNWPQWAAGEGSWPWSVPLAPPTADQARAQWPAFQQWIARWSAWPGPGLVVWEERRWSTLGAQQLPIRLELPDATSIAEALGGGRAAAFAYGVARGKVCVRRWPAAAAVVPRIIPELAGLEDNDYIRLLAAVDWLASNPDSGLYQRQLPIPGVDTKWLEAHGRIVTTVLGALVERNGSLDTVAGLVSDGGLRRVRLLDPALRDRVGGMEEFAASIDTLARLPIAPDAVLIVENLQSLLAVGARPGLVAVHGSGYAAAELATLPWVMSAGKVLYWGDIDIDGLAILGGLRARLPNVLALLMDEQTLLAYRDLWSEDAIARPRTIASLDGNEVKLLQDLGAGRWGVGVRLEQERIPWLDAEAAISTVLSSR